MSRLDATLRARCVELAVVPGRPFDIARRFLAPAAADRALATEALFAVLRELPLAGSDPAPGLAQLAWWHHEIEQASAHGSQHPVVQALLATGGIEQLQEATWNSYLGAIGEWLADPVVPDRGTLQLRLAATAGLEARLSAGTDAAAGAESVRLLEWLARLAPGRPLPSWVPLDLVARHGAEPDAARLAGLAVDLAGLALDWTGDPPPPGPMAEGVRLSHLNAALATRLWSRVRAKPGTRLERGADRLGPGDVYCAWRWARRWPAAH